MKPDYFESYYDEILEKKKEQFTAGNTGEIYTLRDWVYIWIRGILPGVVKHSTMVMYGETMERHMLPRLGEMPLKNITEQTIQNWLHELAVERIPGTMNDTMTEGTIRNTLSVFSGCMRDAQKYGLIDRNPCLQSSWKVPIKNMNEEKAWLSEDQIKVLEPFFEEYAMGIGYQLILYAGVFLSEAVALRWKDVDLNERTIRVDYFLSDLRKTENGEALYQLEPLSGRKARVVPIPHVLNDRLKKEWEENSPEKEDFVLDSGTHTPVRVDRMRAALGRMGRRLGLGKVTPQMLRDTYAMRAVHAGATSDIIAELMGFATPQQVIKRYMSRSPVDKRELIDRMFES